jgi:hypothetical protein
MLGWLRDCNTTHVGCSISEPPRLPTRVIDVGLSSPGGPNPYLLCSDRLEGRYAALSHCWGISSASNPSFKTETHNYDKMRAGMVLDSMPALFQDAVFTTWKLGIQYLWIDSICIIQDSKDDWEAESARMGSIYSNAYVTIVASVPELQAVWRATNIFPAHQLPQATRASLNALWIQCQWQRSRFHQGALSKLPPTSTSARSWR